MPRPTSYMIAYDANGITRGCISDEPQNWAKTAKLSQIWLAHGWRLTWRSEPRVTGEPVEQPAPNQPPLFTETAS
jgi:hypothetical protein